MVQKACRKCRLIVNGDACPVCKDSEMTKTFEGYIILVNPAGEVGKAVNAPTPGTYALKIK